MPPSIWRSCQRAEEASSEPTFISRTFAFHLGLVVRISSACGSKSGATIASTNRPGSANTSAVAASIGRLNPSTEPKALSGSPSSALRAATANCGAVAAPHGLLCLITTAALWSSDLERLLPYVDLVKIDISAMSWDDALALRETCAAQGVTVLAERVENGEELQRCLDAGMNDHISKPIDPVALFETVGRFYKPSGAADASSRQLNSKGWLMPDSKPTTPEEVVDESSDESFPASDPPSWAMGNRTEPSPSRGRDEPPGGDRPGKRGSVPAEEPQ